MDMQSGIPGQPGIDLLDLVSGVVVAHDMDIEVGGDGLIVPSQEPIELCGTVPPMQC